jgi:hypothetical protein
MPSLIRDQIRSRIDCCVSGQDSLDLFREWFVPVSWDIEQTGDAEAMALAYRVDGLLGEASSAGWSDQQLREELAKAIRPVEVRVPTIV